MPGQEAWKLLEKAIVERDIDEVKEKIQIYLKAQPEITFLELEKAFRAQGYGLYLIPLHRASLSITLTNMDLQGNLGKKYTVNYRFSDKPRKQTEKEGWPKDHAEILARLEDAGDPVPCGKAKCSNCNELGHISKNCPQDRIEAERVTVMCYNCGLEGHRVRDCRFIRLTIGNGSRLTATGPTPRVDKFACKNCGKSGHRVAECTSLPFSIPPSSFHADCDCPGTEPRSADDVECRKCNKSRLSGLPVVSAMLTIDVQWVTFLATVPMPRLAFAATVVVKVTWPRNARSRARSNAATVTNMAIPARSVPSPATVSIPSEETTKPRGCLLTFYGSVSRQVSKLPGNGPF